MDDVRERFNEISLDLNLDSAVAFAAWSNYEKTRKVFCLDVSIADWVKIRGKLLVPAKTHENKYVS